MDWLNIPNIVLFITALTAVIALVIQYHAAAKQVRLQNFIEYTKRYQDIILNFPETINEPTFMIDSLSEDVKAKTMRYMRAYFDLCYEEFVLYQKKFIDDEFWEIWKGGMKAAFGKSAFRQAWQKIIAVYQKGAEYAAWICQGPFPILC